MRYLLLGFCGCLAGTTFVSAVVIAATCGHDVHGAPTIEVTDLGEGSSIMHYFSPATLIMDDPKDPRHRAFGECRGQAVLTDGQGNWAGSCVWRTTDGDALVAHWSSQPGDKGVADGQLHGTATMTGTGKLSSIGGPNSWTGLANGGSYFCMD